MNTVSVIVPIYNVEPFIERCVRSLLAQTIQGLELVFVDDASTDGSLQVLQRVLAEEVDCSHQIQIIQNDSNKGPFITRKVGFLAAQGDYLGACDADDWVEPDMYERLYQAAKKSNFDIACCNFVNEFEDHSQPYHYNVDSDPHHCLQLSVDQTRFPSSFFCNLVKRGLLLKAMEQVNPVNYSEDLFAMIYAYYYAGRICHVPQYLYHYNRCNPSSLMSQRTFPAGMWEGQRQNIDKIVALFDSSYHPEYHISCQWLKYKLKLLYYPKSSSLKSYYYEYRECHSDIMHYVYFPINIRRKLRIIYSCYPLFWLYHHTLGARTK